MRAAWKPLCDEFHHRPGTPIEPHRGGLDPRTPISGRLRDKSTTAIDLALALHPTPAVGGADEGRHRTDRRVGGDRGFYAGAVGWCDASGDGQWVVSIRCAELSADRRSALARAGGGIVAESNPDDEVAETTTKFATILKALEVELGSQKNENIRRAVPEDAADIAAMIHALAEFENAPDECAVTEKLISTALFCDSPTVQGHVAEIDGEIGAMALWFLNFSTWDGVAGIYLEDLFVRPSFRRRGLARALLRRWPECLDNGLHAVVMGGAELELRCHCAVRRDRRAAAERVDYLSAVRPRWPSSPDHLIAAGGPAHGRGTEQQAQYGQCHMPAGIPNAGRCDPTARYQATGSRNSWVNTASPRPQRLPGISARPAASTTPPTRTNQTAVPSR